MQMGYAPEDWVGRPVIAILNTWSDAQPCHMHFRSRVDDVSEIEQTAQVTAGQQKGHSGLPVETR